MKKQIISLLVVGILLSLPSCASKDVAQHSLSEKTIQFVVTSNRRLQLEPCGCSLSQHGGLEREWNYITEKRQTASDLLYFVAGVSFIPEATKFDPGEKKYYLSKSDFLAEGFKAMGATALAPSYDDLFLGAGHLKRLSEKHKIPLVSTNLVEAKTGKPLFPTHYEFEHKGQSFLVLGISGNRHVLSPEFKGVRVEDPTKSVNSMLASLPRKENRIVVVLSSLSFDERNEFVDNTQGVHFLLGGPGSEIPGTANQYSTSLMYLNPEGEGRVLYEFSFTPKAKVGPFYNAYVAASHIDTRRILADKLKELDEASPRGIATKQKTDERAKYAKFLERSKTVQTELTAESTPYDYKLIHLGPTYDKGPNPMTRLMARFKSSLGD